MFSSVVFRLLLSLIVVAFLTSTWLYLHIDDEQNHRNFLQPQRQQQQPQIHQEDLSHLVPRLPHLPIFPDIPNSDELIHQTLHEQKPTLAGVGAILYHFLRELHASNERMAPILQKNNNAQQLQQTYFELVEKYLMPLETAYSGRPLFPIRQDDSIFVSVAAFREHLLKETLISLYESANHPSKVFVGVIVQNCFYPPCQGGVHVVGKDKNGRDVLEQLTDGQPDINHIETFCNHAVDDGTTPFQQYCENGQVRVLYVNETDALGPAVARYYSSKLWAGESYYVQVDSHLKFANGWDDGYIEDYKLTKSFPKSILSTYPPGFVNFRQEPPYTPGTRLCKCQIRSAEDYMPRVEMEGRCKEGEVRPTQMAFMGAGFFFVPAQFLVDVPFDPFLPWLFMGEEVALSIRAWTHGYNIYAPRLNRIGHQYRPVRRIWNNAARWNDVVCSLLT